MGEDDFLNELSLNDSIYEEDLFIREILHQQPCFSPMNNESIITTVDTGGATTATTTVSSLSSSANQLSSHQSTYILSFDNSTVIPAAATATDDNADGGYEKYETANISLKRTPENNGSESSKAHQKTRKSRSTAESLEHIMSERKRRQELSEKFIALSATIPGLKKIDKSSVLSEAIDYMKKLKEQVKELEEENKKLREDNESLLLRSSTLKKPSFFHHNNHLNNNNNVEEDRHHHHHLLHQDITICSSETLNNSCSDDDDDEKCFRIINEGLPEVELRVLQKQALLRILCEKHKNVMLTILAQLNSLHLSIINSSVLNFAGSVLDITIIAEVEEQKIEVKEVVNKLRLALLEMSHSQ